MGCEIPICGKTFLYCIPGLACRIERNVKLSRPRVTSQAWRRIRKAFGGTPVTPRPAAGKNPCKAPPLALSLSRRS